MNEHDYEQAMARLKQIKLLLLTIFVFLTGSIFGQKSEQGGFTSFEEFKNNNPKFADSFTILKRTTADIKAWGGNDYKVESADELITKNIIKREIWGIYKNDTLYLNGMSVTGLIGYVRVEISGKYSFLRPSFPVNLKIQKELGLNDPQYGYLFGAVGGAFQGAKMALKRIPLIYNMETGEKMLLTEPTMIKILEKYPDLRNEFNIETDKKNEGVLLKYLRKINEREEVTTEAK
ncbi:MAG: DUF6563 family protein [Bacteroidales bacterium]